MDNNRMRNETPICPDANAAFERYFELLGYTTHWEGRRETGERWYEICDPAEGVLCFQISMPPPPIAELLADLPHLIEGRSGVGPTDYWIACKDNNRLRDLLSRMQAHPHERS